MPAQVTALITGITGQDGSLLAELLLNKGYEVHGVVRRASNIERARIDHLITDANLHERRLFLHYCDLEDLTTLRRILFKVRPQEFYHLAGQSHVGLSFEVPESTCDFTAMATLRILEVLRDMESPPRFLNIGSSEIFGRPTAAPQSAETPMRPVSPYGVAKAFAVNITRVYRESFGMHASSSICFNHESPRRSLSFVTRKIARAAAEISLGKRKELALGNLDTSRDWGYAPEYVEAMWRMLQLERPQDLVLATGTLISLRSFLAFAFEEIGLEWDRYVTLDSRLVRPAEPSQLVGDPSQAKVALGWQAQTVGRALATLMVRAELATLTQQP